jgi:hypothetical protein
VTEQELRDYGEVVKETLRLHIERVDKVIADAVKYKADQEMSAKTKVQLIASSADSIGFYDFKMACLDYLDG